MSQYQRTPTVSHFYDKILAKTGTLEVDIKIDTKVAKKLVPKLKVKKHKVDTQVDSKVERSKTVDSKKWFKSWKVLLRQLLWTQMVSLEEINQKWAPTGISREHNQQRGDFNDLSVLGSGGKVFHTLWRWIVACYPTGPLSRKASDLHRGGHESSKTSSTSAGLDPKS